MRSTQAGPESGPALKQLASEEDARGITLSIAMLIDGFWLRHAKSNDQMDAQGAIRHIEAFVDERLTSVTARS